jgi:cob(I)alamin adenosyltransferase
MTNQFKIYTKTGDDGTSGLIGGTRVSKSDIRLEAYGTVDELNSWIGLLCTGQFDPVCFITLQMIQNKLFVIGSILATDPDKIQASGLKVSCDESDINKIEAEIDRMQSLLPPLNNFILPGGSTLAAYAHIARTVCRRAERRISTLDKIAGKEVNIGIFINRLSDYLFVLARYINHLKNADETIWQPAKT